MKNRAQGSKSFFRQVTLVICLFFCLGGSLWAQEKIYRPSPSYVQIGKPDQAEGKRILEDFRRRTLAGDMYLEFELRVMPRRGETWIVPARLWTGRNDLGPIWRLELLPKDAAQRCTLLVQNGPRNALWRWPAAISAKGGQALGREAMFERLAGTDLTAFDLQMPFVYWDDFVFEGVARVRGRPAHVFLMYPPAEVSSARPDLTGVRVYLDTQFNALVQSEQYGAQGALLKSVTILDLKKVDDQWIPKTIDVRDEETRNKTRFAVTRAAVGQDFLPVVFSPEVLDEPVQPPPEGQIRDVSP